MAGRPLRRLRREIAAQQQGDAPRIPEFPEPSKPIEDMTTEELRAHMRAELRSMKRAARERQLRQGRVKPRNRAEMEIFAKDLLGDREQPDV